MALFLESIKNRVVADPVDTEVSATGMQTRRHVLLRDETGTARGWGSVNDRAAERVLVSVLVDPELEAGTADGIATTLFAWAARAATDLALDRGVEKTHRHTRP